MRKNGFAATGKSPVDAQRLGLPLSAHVTASTERVDN